MDKATDQMPVTIELEVKAQKPYNKWINAKHLMITATTDKKFFKTGTDASGKPFWTSLIHTSSGRLESKTVNVYDPNSAEAKAARTAIITIESKDMAMALQMFLNGHGLPFREIGPVELTRKLCGFMNDVISTKGEIESKAASSSAGAISNTTAQDSAITTDSDTRPTQQSPSHMTITPANSQSSASTLIDGPDPMCLAELPGKFPGNMHLSDTDTSDHHNFSGSQANNDRNPSPVERSNKKEQYKAAYHALQRKKEEQEELIWKQKMMDAQAQVDRNDVILNEGAFGVHGNKSIQDAIVREKRKTSDASPDTDPKRPKFGEPGNLNAGPPLCMLCRSIDGHTINECPHKA